MRLFTHWMCLWQVWLNTFKQVFVVESQAKLGLLQSLFNWHVVQLMRSIENTRSMQTEKRKVVIGRLLKEKILLKKSMLDV